MKGFEETLGGFKDETLGSFIEETLAATWEPGRLSSSRKAIWPQGSERKQDGCGI